MTLEQAKRIVGNQSTHSLKNMVYALSAFNLINTMEDNKNLEAAKIVLADRKRGKSNERRIRVR